MTLSAIFVNRLVVVVYQIVQKEQKVFKSIEWKIWKNVGKNNPNGWNTLEFWFILFHARRR